MKKIPDFTSPVFKKTSDLSVRISQIPSMDVAFQTMALSEYELLVATIHKLNELVTMTNSYSELIDEILKWVVGDGLDASVKDMLTVWLNDGTLENLINETLFNSKLDKSEFETFKTIQNKKNNRLNLIYLDMFGDFNTDITLVLNSAISYMNNNSGTTLILPSGMFTFNDTVSVQKVKGVIKGQGKNSTILKYTGGGNAFELGRVLEGDIGWDAGYSSVIDLKDLTILNDSETSKNGLLVHSIGSLIDNVCVDGFKNGHGLLAEQFGYFTVSKSSFLRNKVGVYARWSINFTDIHVTQNSMVGMFLGGACKISNSLIEWQKPVTGFNPNTRLINLITFSPIDANTVISNTYLEHDHVYYGYNQKYNTETLSFENGEMPNALTSLVNCYFSDQNKQYIYSGFVTYENTKFVGGNFGVESITKYSDTMPNGYSKPTVKFGNTNRFINVNNDGKGNYIQLGKAPTLLKNTNFSYSDVNGGTATKTYSFEDDLEGAGQIWNDGDFNFSHDVIDSDNTWDNNKVLECINYKTVTNQKAPEITWELDLEEGVTYYISFNAKVPSGTTLIYNVTSDSDISYGHADYKVTGDERSFSYVTTDGVWSRRMKEFTCRKTEKGKLTFKLVDKDANHKYSIQSVSVSTSPGKL